MAPDKPALRAQLRAERDLFASESSVAVTPPEAFLARLTPGQIVATYDPVGSEADPALLAAAAVERGCRLALPLVVDRATPIETIQRTVATDRPSALLRGFIVTEAGAYLGLCSALGLVQATLRRTEERNRELDRARRDAVEASRAKSTFLANVSHELRTPLNVILGYTETILHQPQIYADALPHTLLNDVRHIYQSSDHLIHLINDLLDLSRAEIGALDIFPELLDPRELLEKVFESMAARATAVAVRWQLDLPAQLPLLEADPVRVRQVVLNLLSNAEKWTTEGQITLGANVEPPCLHVWVADTGGGIPHDLHERIFEPFVTGQQMGHAHEGIGLGLSIVRQLVSLHGGTLRLASQPGRGSTFHIMLPLPRLHNHSAGGVAMRPLALLLVAAASDDQALSHMYRRQELLPYHVAPDEQIERLFAAVQPVALVCDVDRAHAHEWALIAQLRQHPQGCMLPFLLYSSLDTADNGAWLTRVLVKPLRSTQLLDMLTELGPSQATGTVLIVDDDAECCAFYQQLVVSVLPAAAVRVASGGAAALAMVEHEIPSLVILDLMMPGVDGFAVIQHLRANEATRHVPVLVLSGKVLSSDDVQRLSYHQIVYQSKDVLAADELAAHLQRLQSGACIRSVQTSRLVKYAIAYMQTHYQRSLSREEIADALGINQSYLSEIFQHELGLSPWDYLNRYRIRQAKVLLHDRSRSITVIASSVGFNDSSYFGRVFRRIVGCSPQQYRAQGRVLAGGE